MKFEIHRITLVGCIIGLVLFYVFQKNIMGIFDPTMGPGFSTFLVKKTVRFLVNDFLMIGIIYGLFNKKEFVHLALLVQLLGLVFLLLPYLILKYNMGAYNGPLISFLHRLVLNPLLLILLIPALYLQQQKEKKT